MKGLWGKNFAVIEHRINVMGEQMKGWRNATQREREIKNRGHPAEIYIEITHLNFFSIRYFGKLFVFLKVSFYVMDYAILSNGGSFNVLSVINASFSFLIHTKALESNVSLNLRFLHIE